ncbi:uncharacterized protein LOC120116876 [Hibiscus syriacus]|uniref:uncharacterized protein LOC120116876 n=1 Tax=Hibiscus syriacus TaxID=106335 RepID=UPI001921B2C2|nr:uncharacterized protein LOC120116876 [Hibiscus syriacus]
MITYIPGAKAYSMVLEISEFYVNESYLQFYCFQGNELIEQNASNANNFDSDPNEIHRFEQLRNELIELEKRVKRSADQSAYEEDVKVTVDRPRSIGYVGRAQLVEVKKKVS